MPATQRIAGVGLATLSGVAVAVQSRINGELGVRLRDGFGAAVISFGIGLLVLLVLVPASPTGRRGLTALRTALRGGALRPWQCLGGVFGAFLVATQGLTIGTLGVAVFTVAVVAGQSGSSLAVDRAGIGPAGAHPITGQRLAGASLAVVAVLLSVSDRFDQPDTLVLAVLPLLAGVGIAWQQAVNGRVRGASGSALTATLVNFTVGTVALLVAFAVDVAVRGWPAGSLPAEPWLYLGGPIGIVFIAVAAAIVRFTGVLLLGLATIAGQVVGAVLVDLVVPTAASHPSLTTLGGAALTLVAVLVAALAPSRSAQA
ncbi:DMT family transporter [Micromonospora musae]|uniref:DMT family transporter n=2 Tax=Micromonosporaceae TaxID=28056 RepID=UPI003445B6FE